MFKSIKRNMARQDAKVAMRHQPSPQRKLEYLLNETYIKIDELKELLRKEVALTGINAPDLAVGRMFSRQDYLVTLCAEACTEQERRNASHSMVQGTSSSRHVHHHLPTHKSTAEQPRSSKVEKDDGKHDGSWYGSLDRSLAKKKKHQIMDKKRRHTKTIGSMAGLDVIKKHAELKPDEQYEIGLPAAPKVTSSRSSIFPMTQHQYYTALMESKMTKKPTYPLEVRQPPYPPPPPAPILVQRPMSTWAYHPMENLDENKNMRKQVEIHHQPQPSPQLPKASANLVPLPSRSLGNELTFRHSSKSSSGGSKKWYETNLDECPATPVMTQNPSPSPSMLSSTRGSSRGSVASGMDTIDGAIGRIAISSPANESTEFTSKSSESSESWSGMGNEVTKPFEMSDYYKYSTKFRSRNSPVSEELSPHEHVRSTNGSSVVHSRQSSQIRPPNFDVPNGYRDTNGNPSVGPKLPPKQRRNQNKSISSSSGVIFEGDIANGDPTKEVWITNEPTFV